MKIVPNRKDPAVINLSTDAYTPKQVEENTGFTIATLATWRSRGKGPKFVRIMGRIYYMRTDVQEWLNAQIQAA